MANALYPLWKAALLQHSANSALTHAGGVKVALVDTGVYTYSAAHQYFSSVESAVVGIPQTITDKTFTNGVFDGNNVIFTAVTGANVEALIIYIADTSNSVSRLVAYIDTSVTGLPATPNGGDITITWNASGIFSL